MSNLYKCEVLVLRRRPLGEADEVVSFLSPERGRFEASVRGSRRSRSPFVGRLEPFNQLAGLFARGRSLDHLTQAELVRARVGLQVDLERLASGAYLLDLVAGVCPAQEPPGAIYPHLLACLDLLEQGAPARRVLRWFELRLSDLLGSAPELGGCGGCGEAGAGWFSPWRGGLVCARCREPEESVLGLSPPARAALRHLRRVPLEAAVRLALEPGPARELERALQGHLQAHWPQSGRAREVLRSLAPS